MTSGAGVLQVLREDVATAMRDLTALDKRLRVEIKGTTDEEFVRVRDLIDDASDHWAAMRDLEQELDDPDDQVLYGTHEWTVRYPPWREALQTAKRFIERHDGG